MRYPASSVQRRIWFLHQLDPGLVSYNMARAYRLRGRLDGAALERGVAALVARHEALRTGFEALDGEPHAVVAADMAPAYDVVDLAYLSAEERERELERRIADAGWRPFEVRRAGLTRWLLFRLDRAGTDHVLLLAVNHLVCDGWSIDVLWRDLAELYEAHLARRAPQLRALVQTYADVAWRERERLRSGAMDGLVERWLVELRGAPVLLDLPADAARRPDRERRGGVHHFEIGPELRSGLARLARSHQATTFTCLLAALQTLLHRYTGQEDVLVGVPVANRHSREDRDVVGPFANVLVLRGRLRGRL